MNFSCTRIRQSSALMPDAGQATSSCRARTAFRMRVSRSAIGSVMAPISVPPLPARLGHTGDHPEMRQLAKADAAKAELPEEPPRPPAAMTARIAADLELRLT